MLLTFIAATLAGVLARYATVRNDADIFLPRSATVEGRVIAERLRKGPAASTYLIGIRGAKPKVLAEMSERLAGNLQRHPRLAMVANGRFRRDDATFDWIFRNRYLLAPAVQARDFEPAALRQDGKHLRTELATSAGLIGPDRLFADLTGRTAVVARRLMGGGGPATQSGVWFSGDHKTALLIVRAKAEGLDLDAQEAAISAINAAFIAAKAVVTSGGDRARITLAISGPGVIGVATRANIKSEAVLLSGLASGFVLLLMIAVLRSVGLIWAFSLTLGFGLLAGVAAVQVVFGQIHGITITFGAMIIGLCVDYPLHVAMHSSSDAEIGLSAKRIWPMLRLSAASTVAAFVPLVFSSFPGLSQLGLVAIVGLTTAVLFARYILPMIAGSGRSIAVPMPIGFLRRNRKVFGVAALSVIIAIVGTASLVVALGGRIWEDSLARLSPVDPQQLALDRQLRRDLTTVEPGLIILVSGDSREAVLRRVELVSAKLNKFVENGDLKGFEAPTLYMPSLYTQRIRQSALPSSERLVSNLKAAALYTEFAADAFDEFVKDVARARSSDGQISQESVERTAFGQRLASLLLTTSGKWFGTVLLQGLNGPVSAIRSIAIAPVPGAQLVEFRKEAVSLVRTYRRETLGWLGIGALLSILLLAIGIRRMANIVRVVTPVLAAVVVATAGLLVIGIPLSLFHILALMIVAGLGFDYAVFLLGASDGAPISWKAFQSVTVCAISTVGVYSILSFSSVPVLSGIGLTTAIGATVAYIVTAVIAVNSRARI